MTEETNTAPAENSTGDAPGEQSGEEEKTARELLEDLSTDDLDALLLSAASDKFVAKDRVEEIVTQRLNSERESRKAEAERKALEEQNKFKELYETEAEAKQQAEERAKKAEEDSKQNLIRYELRDALRTEHINPERMDLAFKVADTSSVEVEGSEVRGVDKVVTSLKDSSPEWFGNAERKPSGFDGVPAGDPDGASKEQEQANKEIAARQIHRMF